jgi:DNA processing protein
MTGTQPPEYDNDLAYWLALLRAPGVGAVTFRDLLERHRTPRSLFEDVGAAAPLAEVTRAYLRAPDWEQVDQDLRWLEEPDHHLLTLFHPAYPPLLAELRDAPPALFLLGEPAVLRQPQLAMVGSRNPSHDGMALAREFAGHLSEAGLVITSGLALGIDGASHEGALAAGGLSVAVTGTGLDRVYPASHHDLAHRIAHQGALVSEFPPGTPPKAEHFPRRNRIISGLSLGTLVVEAAVRSGSLITARLASEQGREVFAIPGSIHNPLARGCHALIRQGAKLVESAQDVLEELGPLAGVALEMAPVATPEAPGSLSEDYSQLLDFMGYSPISVDALVARTGLTAEEVSSMLLLLELKDFVHSEPGGRYVRTEKRA